MLSRTDYVWECDRCHSRSSNSVEDVPTGWCRVTTKCSGEFPTDDKSLCGECRAVYELFLETPP